MGYIYVGLREEGEEYNKGPSSFLCFPLDELGPKRASREFEIVPRFLESPLGRHETGLQLHFVSFCIILHRKARVETDTKFSLEAEASDNMRRNR